MLSIENLSYSIDNKIILENISQTFEAGKINLIIGPNGAGKSTLIKLISGQLKSKTGTIHYTGNANPSVQELAKTRAVLSQNIDLSFPLKVSEIVMMGRYPHFESVPSKKDKIACEDAMSFFDILKFSDRNFMTLSGGEKQRVHFARVLSQIWYSTNTDQRYLIMDEPLTFLDVHYQYDFMYKIVELAKQKDLIIIGVLHDLNLTAKFADKIILINEGKILASGDKKEVLTTENILKAYQLTPIIHQIEGSFFLTF
ncbi:heme ABC transporter ATP-binding protein [Flavobacterium sp. T12S277]|uniref:heme ABC transporter ATP-binding protein n=1 Tax=Flavobacterium sp. T12S277 TaxID=3402752 RepID=UPI003ADEF2BA